MHKFILYILFIYPINLSAESNTWTCVDDETNFIDDDSIIIECVDSQGKRIEGKTIDILGENYTVIYSFSSGVFKGNSINNNLQGRTKFNKDSGIYKDKDIESIEGSVVGLHFNGEGKITYKKSSFLKDYVGTLKNSERHGAGTLRSKDGVILTGNFQDDILISGRETYINGDYYEGEFSITSDYVHEGKGKYVYVNGEIYEGDYVDGDMEGYGTFDYMNGESYKGNFSKNSRNGYGEYFHTNGDTYKGYFTNSDRGPYGTYTYNSDNFLSDSSMTISYMGEYKNNQPNGIGTKIGTDFVYQGNFINNERDGYGVHLNKGLDSETKSIFSGYFRDDSANGIGKLIYPDGEYYEGGFREGLYHGNGKLHRPTSGQTWIGFFKDGYMEGKGMLLLDNGMKYEGGFKKGFQHGKGMVTFEDKTSFFVEYNEGEYLGELENIPNFNTKRLALVIGNEKYSNGPLDNAVDDSIGIKNVLLEAGFEVIHKQNLNHKEFTNAVYEFKNRIDSLGENTTALFYYAGHAVQVNGINYLNPIDANIRSERDLGITSIDASLILSALDKASSGIKIMILDACRNNPFRSFTRSPTQGLASMTAAKGTFIAYSTAPGSVALDGGIDGYSYYAGSLIQSIRTEGITIEETFKKTRQSVVRLTNEEQIPWESSSLLGDFYFIKKANLSKSLSPSQ